MLRRDRRICPHKGGYGGHSRRYVSADEGLGDQNVHGQDVCPPSGKRNGTEWRPDRTVQKGRQGLRNWEPSGLGIAPNCISNDQATLHRRRPSVVLGLYLVVDPSRGASGISGVGGVSEGGTDAASTTTFCGQMVFHKESYVKRGEIVSKRS